MSSPSFAGAAHITHGDSAAGDLRQLGGKVVLVRRDLLTIGPCDVDPQRHRELRRAHWHIDDAKAAAGLVGVDDLRAALPDPAVRPLVIWTTAAWSDSCYLWCLLDALDRIGIDWGRVRLAQAVSPHGHPLGGIGDDALREALDRAAPPSPEKVREGVALWRRYASPSPLGFDAARRLGSPAYPALGAIARGHTDWFPWSRAGRLELSEADALLLGSLTEDWRTMRQILRSARGDEILEHLFAWIGDSSVLDRIDAWRAHGAVEWPLAEGEDRTWKTLKVRLTPAGMKLRDEGAASVAELAPVWIGGCRVNDPGAPFVRVSTPSGDELVAA